MKQLRFQTLFSRLTDTPGIRCEVQQCTRTDQGVEFTYVGVRVYHRDANDVELLLSPLVDFALVQGVNVTAGNLQEIKGQQIEVDFDLENLMDLVHVLVENGVHFTISYSDG